MDDRGRTTAPSAISQMLRAQIRVRQLALVLDGGKEAWACLTLDDRGISVGREPGGPVVLALRDSETSRQHARVEIDASDEARIVDCESRNGIFVHGARIDGGAALRDGSVVRLGRSLFVFVDATLAAGQRLEPETDALAGMSLAMQSVRGEIALIARSTTPVLVLGESGTGKERAAAELHRLSGRTGALISVNCATLSPALAESQLFGHAAGAFSGATGTTEGLFAAADEGTLFLDEVGELEPTVQAKLLRALATGEVTPLGRTTPRKVDVRVVAATHRDLAARIESEAFRGDLFARLSAHRVQMPPLRARREDVLRIAWRRLGVDKSPKRLAPSAAEALLLHDWPFNVRELENVLGSASMRATDEIRVEHLPAEIARGLDARGGSVSPPATLPLEVVVARDSVPNASQLATVVARFGGNLAEVAEYFGKDRKQIYRWAERLGIDLGGRKG